MDFSLWEYDVGLASIDRPFHWPYIPLVDPAGAWILVERRVYHWAAAQGHILAGVFFPSGKELDPL